MRRAPEQRLPAWFRVRLSKKGRYNRVSAIVRSGGLHTVCEGAACPNRNECWSGGTATFLILGDVCTRRCGFCNVPKGEPDSLDHDEPRRVAEAIRELNLRYAVITSVTRDDLPDGGAGIFAETIEAVRKESPGCRIEVLVPDFQGSEQSLETVLAARPDVLNHNLETVPSLYSRVRPLANFDRSVNLLNEAKTRGFVTKTGLMLGLGESKDEALSIMDDVRKVSCDILTLGQYLQPGKKYLPVEKYYTPAEFEELRQEGMRRGFGLVLAGPLVRSSYKADKCCIGSVDG